MIQLVIRAGEPAAEFFGVGTVEVSEEQLRDYYRRHGAQSTAWPTWAREMETKRMAEDRGVGDTVERTVGLMGSESFLAWYRANVGAHVPCPNCPAVWNAMYSYGKTPDRK